MNDLSTQSRQWLARLRETRLPLWVGLLLLILLLAVFAWQQVAVGRAEARLAGERAAMTQKFEADRAALVGQVRQRAAAQADESRRRFALALAWAVRGELIRNNLDQVDQYFAELVKLPDHTLVLLAAPDGKVVVSTDRKHLGADASGLVPAEALSQANIALLAEADGAKLLAIPVMGLNARLGTVLLRYQEADPLAGL
jgi:hypothetical protein